MRPPRRSKPLPRPHKKPSQARAAFTVNTLYEAFVRIWRRDGPDAATTRAIAEESGYAVGTLYEYFPNRAALFSGYVRHCLDDLCRRLAETDADLADRPWRQRLGALVAASLDRDGEAPWFDATMLAMEHQIADTDHHRRAFSLLCRVWGQRLAAWPDLDPVDDGTVETLVLTVWGAWRYRLLLGLGPVSEPEVERVTSMVERLLAGATP